MAGSDEVTRSSQIELDSSIGWPIASGGQYQNIRRAEATPGCE
jgi:hypothetical protein